MSAFAIPPTSILSSPTMTNNGCQNVNELLLFINARLHLTGFSVWKRARATDRYKIWCKRRTVDRTSANSGAVLTQRVPFPSLEDCPGPRGCPTGRVTSARSCRRRNSRRSANLVMPARNSNARSRSDLAKPLRASGYRPPTQCRDLVDLPPETPPPAQRIPLP